jgi:hypothetical protein
MASYPLVANNLGYYGSEERARDTDLHTFLYGTAKGASHHPFCNLNTAILLLRIYLNECDSGYNKVTCIPMFIAALFTISKLWKQSRWIKKMYIYTQWNFTQPQRKMKFCHLQINGWTGEYHLK